MKEPAIQLVPNKWVTESLLMLIMVYQKMQLNLHEKSRGWKAGSTDITRGIFSPRIPARSCTTDLK